MLCRVCALLGHVRLCTLPSSFAHAPRLPRGSALKGWCGRLRSRRVTYVCVCSLRFSSRASSCSRLRTERGAAGVCAVDGSHTSVYAPSGFPRAPRLARVSEPNAGQRAFAQSTGHVRLCTLPSSFAHAPRLPRGSALKGWCGRLRSRRVTYVCVCSLRFSSRASSCSRLRTERGAAGVCAKRICGAMPFQICGFMVVQ